MRTMTAHFLVIMLFGLVAGLSMTAQRVGAAPAPQERVAGLLPGVHTLQDAERVLGRYDIAVPGHAAVYAGGSHVTTAYRWASGITYGGPGVVIETELGSSVIAAILVDFYPDLPTSRGLEALMPETTAVELYGMPNSAFELTLGESHFRELLYIDQGLLVILTQIPGRPNWTISHLLLTSPAYLRNAVAMRVRYAQAGRLEDITDAYRVWARMAIAPR